jgi:hypothetical protein
MATWLLSGKASTSDPAIEATSHEPVPDTAAPELTGRPPNQAKSTVSAGEAADVLLIRVTESTERRPAPFAEVHAAAAGELGISFGKSVDRMSWRCDGQGVCRVPRQDLDQSPYRFWATDGSGSESPWMVASTAEKEIQLRLLPAASITGSVIGAGKADFPSVRVAIFSPALPESPGTREVQVDEEGRFSAVVRPGWVDLFAYSPSRVPSAPQELTLAAGEVRTVTLTLGGIGSAAKVRFVTDTGEPLPKGFTFFAGTAPIIRPFAVGEGGLAEVAGFDSQRGLTLRAWASRKSDGHWATCTVARDLTSAELLEQPTIVVPSAASGTFNIVRESEGGDAPCPDVALTMRSESPDSSADPRHGLHTGRSNAGGQWYPFQDRCELPGLFTLSAGPLGTVWRGELRAATGAIRVVLPPADSIRAQLHDWTGEPLTSEDVFLEVADISAPTTMSPLADALPFAETEVTIYVPRPLAPGTALRVVETATSARWVGLPRSGEPLTITLSRESAILDLSVREAELGQRLNLQGSGSGQVYQAATGSDGKVKPLVIAPDNYKIWLLRYGRWIEAGSAEIHAGQRSQMAVSLPP